MQGKEAFKGKVSGKNMSRFQKRNVWWYVIKVIKPTRLRNFFHLSCSSTRNNCWVLQPFCTICFYRRKAKSRCDVWCVIKHQSWITSSNQEATNGVHGDPAAHPGGHLPRNQASEQRDPGDDRRAARTESVDGRQLLHERSAPVSGQVHGRHDLVIVGSDRPRTFDRQQYGAGTCQRFAAALTFNFQFFCVLTTPCSKISETPWLHYPKLSSISLIFLWWSCSYLTYYIEILNWTDWLYESDIRRTTVWHAY